MVPGLRVRIGLSLPPTSAARRARRPTTWSDRDQRQLGGPLGHGFRGRLAGATRAARGQGRERRGDDARARLRARAGRLHDHHGGVRRLHAWRGLLPGRPRAGGGPRVGAPGDARRPLARRSARPAARVGSLGRARIDARHAGHGAEPRSQRRDGPRPGGALGQRALRVGLLQALRADVRQRGSGRPRRALRARDRGRQVGPRRLAGHRARRGGAARAHGGVPGLLRVPSGPARAARALDPRGVRLLAGRSRGRPTGASTASPTTGAPR